MYSCNCDNCGETYRDDHSGFTAYPDESNLREAMDNDDWYTGHTDEDHQDKQYCPNCFKQHETIDDKIIIDESRMVVLPSPLRADSSEQ